MNSVLTYESWQRREITNPPSPETLARRAAIHAQTEQWTRETRAACERTAAVYARAEAAPTEAEGMAIIAEHSRELLADWRARNAA